MATLATWIGSRATHRISSPIFGNHQTRRWCKEKAVGWSDCFRGWILSPWELNACVVVLQSFWWCSLLAGCNLGCTIANVHFLSFPGMPASFNVQSQINSAALCLIWTFRSFTSLSASWLSTCCCKFNEDLLIDLLQPPSFQVAEAYRLHWQEPWLAGLYNTIDVSLKLTA